MTCQVVWQALYAAGMTSVWHRVESIIHHPFRSGYGVLPILALMLVSSFTTPYSVLCILRSIAPLHLFAPFGDFHTPTSGYRDICRTCTPYGLCTNDNCPLAIPRSYSVDLSSQGLPVHFSAPFLKLSTVACLISPTSFGVSEAMRGPERLK